MNTSILKIGFTILLSLFFLASAFANLFPSPEMTDDYIRWGYPWWFSHVTGWLQVATAILLLSHKTRFYGIVLGGMISIAAIATLVVHGELVHALSPLALLLVLAGLASVTPIVRHSRSTGKVLR